MDTTQDRDGAASRLAELVDAAGADGRARRRLLDRAARVLSEDAATERKARAAELAAERRVRAVEADADARIRAAEARLRVQERERDARRAERDADRAAQAADREDRTEAAEHRRATWARRRELAGAAAPATLSMVVYLAAVASAVFGQVSVATGRYGWPMWRALVLAGFIELMALAMALTANRLRIRGERALAPRVLTWVFAGFAATINVWGHWQDPLMAVGLGAASLGGITLWEIRSSARHRDALRRAGQLAQPLPPLGLRFWLLQPAVATTAYRVGVRTRVSAAAAPLVTAAEQQRAARRAGTRPRRSGWWFPAAAMLTVAAAMATARPATASIGQYPLYWIAGAAVLTAVGCALMMRGRRPAAPALARVPAPAVATDEDTAPARLDPWTVPDYVDQIGAWQATDAPISPAPWTGPALDQSTGPNHPDQTTPDADQTATGPDRNQTTRRTAGPVRSRTGQPKTRTSPARRRTSPATQRLSLAERVDQLDQRYPDRIPGRNQAMRDLGWTSADQTSAAVNALRARRAEANQTTREAT